MPLTKIQKQKILESLREKIEKQRSIVFASVTGLKVKDLTNLRKKMKKENCELKVAKKTLISLAFKEKGVEIDTKKLEGEIALGFGYQDEILPFKIIYNFSKENENLKILGGLIGKEILEKERAITIARLPDRQELLARLVGSIFVPISGMVNILQGNLRNLVLVLSVIKK